MARDYLLKCFTPELGYILRSDSDATWDGFKDPLVRQSYEPKGARTLWSVTPVLSLQGVYEGDAIIRGYEVIKHNRKELHDGDKLIS